MFDLNVRHDNKLAAILAFVFVSLAYATIYFSPGIPHGGQGPLLFLFLISIPLAFSKKCFQHLDKKFFFTFVFVFLAAIPLAVKSGEGEALDAPSRFLIMAIVFLALYRIPIDGKWVLRSALFSCLIASAISIYIVMTSKVIRVNLGIGMLESGYTLSLMIFVCMSAIYNDNSKYWKAVGIVVVFLGILTLIQTGTRGAWLSALITSIVFFKLSNPKDFNKKILVSALIILVAGFTSFNTSPTVNKRVNATIKDLKFLGKLEYPTSANIRIIFWKHAFNGFKQSPITGLSYQENAALRKYYAEKYNVNLVGTTDGRSSSHNEILNAMVQKGVLGLMAIMLIYLIPLQHFVKKLKSSDQTVRFYAISGICTISAIAVSGLTEAPLMHTSVSVTYGMLMILLYHSIRNQELADQKDLSCSPSS